MTISAALIWAAAATAGPDWTEVPDAGSTPASAQRISPVAGASVRSVSGQTTGFAPDREDMYLIQITDPCNFVVCTSQANLCATEPPFGFADFDTQLWLFDLNGLGILANDDAAVGDLGSRILNEATDSTGRTIPGPGCYYLAISGFGDVPVSANGPIFAMTNSLELSGPDGPGGGMPIVGWSGTGAVGEYTMRMTLNTVATTPAGTCIGGAVAPPPAPANELCASAVSFPLVAGLPFTGNLSGATNDGPTGCGSTSNLTAWHTFTPTATGQYTISMCGSDQSDTHLGIYVGSTCSGAVTFLACNDDSCGLGSQVSVPLSAGQLYTLRVATFNATVSNGGGYTILITLQSAIPPANDDCGTPIIIGNGATCATLVGGTGGFNANSCGGTLDTNDVYFRYTATNTGLYRVSVCSTEFDPVVSIHTACPVPPSTTNQIASACGAGGGISTLGCFTGGTSRGATTMATLTTGTVYTIRVAGDSGGTGAGVGYGRFWVTVIPPAPPPANDECAGASIAWGSSTGAVPFNNAGATNSSSQSFPSTGCPAAGPINNDVWHLWTAPTSGFLSVLPATSSPGNRVAVYAALTCPPSGGTLLACEDTGVATAIAVTAGQQYLFQVGGTVSGTTGGGTITLTLDPYKGACCNAGVCSMTTATLCGMGGGTYQGDNTICNPMTGLTTAAASTDTPIAIPDNVPAGISSTINIADSFAIGDVSVTINIGSGHTWVGDLTATLTHGTDTVDLFRRIGTGPGTTVGDNSDLTGMYSFSDGAAQTLWSAAVLETGGGVATPIPPAGYRSVTNNALPTSLQAVFNGKNSAGNWVLAISDNAAGDVGTLTSWSIGLNHGAASVCAVLVNIVSANPPNGHRDTLENTTTGLSPEGIGVMGTPNEGAVMNYGAPRVTFSATPVPAPTAANITVNCTGGSCPTVTTVAGAGAGPYTLSLSGQIPVLHCITFLFAGTNAGQKLQYSFGPGDMNLNNTISGQDVLALVSAINTNTTILSRHDVNRNATVSGQDVLRLVQLINGVSATQVFNGAVVAACP